jgi:hypothetical protein
MDRSSSPSSSCDSTSAKSTISSTASNDGSKQGDLATTSRKKSAKLAKKSSREIKRPKLKSYKSDILQSQWETMFGHLLDYKAVNGNCLVPHRYVENPALGAWVSTQRRQYKVWKEGRAWTGKANSTPIDPIRGQRLEEIGFVWSTNNPLKIPWERRYQELVGFKAKFGVSFLLHARCKPCHVSHYQLARFLQPSLALSRPKYLQSKFRKSQCLLNKVT